MKYITIAVMAIAVTSCSGMNNSEFSNRNADILFSKNDLDHDGRIKFSEMFPANNDGSRNGDINKITFMEYDSNSDGYITRDEFIFLQKMQLDCDKFVSKKTNSRDRLFDLCKMELSLKRNN